jgi:hypothetical protein
MRFGPRALPVLEKAFRQELRDDCASRPEEKVTQHVAEGHGRSF